MAKEKIKKEAQDKKIKSSGKGEKFADMSATAVVIDEESLEKELTQEVKPKKGGKQPKARGKKYQEAKKLVDKTKSYTPKEALELLKKISLAKFGGSVEAHLNVTGKDLSGEAKLPYFKGKALRVTVFDEGLLEEIKAGKINFDVLLATPADMPKIMPLAKILGPKGLLPNPKNGTIVPDLPAGRQVPKALMAKFSSSALRYKTEKDFPIIHTVIGQTNQPVEELAANLEALIKGVGSKNIKKVFVKATMSPSIRVSLS